MTPDQWVAKARADFVTEVDREAERMIAAVLLDHFPGSSVVGEELTPEGSTPRSPDPTISRITWIVDPLDGTTNFLHRIPQYAVSIAATVNGVLEAGCVLHVSPDLCYTATRGGGAFVNGAPISVSAIGNPAHALIGTGFPFKNAEAQLPRYLPIFSAVARHTAGMRRPGSAALDLASVACGQFDGFFELELAPWDVAAGTLLVREAGGLVTNLDGDPDVLRTGSIVAGNPVVHRWLLDAAGEQEGGA